MHFLQKLIAFFGFRSFLETTGKYLEQVQGPIRLGPGFLFWVFCLYKEANSSKDKVEYQSPLHFSHSLIK